jgi:tRNA-dihydrouridine synthase B
MISANALLRKSAVTQQRYVVKDPMEGPVCFQLAATEPETLAEATKMVTDYGADLVDLNCGCPVRKARKQGAGSGLLATPSKIFHMIEAMKKNTHQPVSIKIRVDGKSSEKFNTEIAKVVNESGADYLIVHGRHWSERYATPPHYEQIQFFVEELKIPVIGNGDVACIDSLKKMLATGCAGVMISRAGVGQPWLIKKLITEMQKETFTMPSMQEIHAIFIEHVIRIKELLNNEKFAIFQARKLGKYYSRTVKNRAEFCGALHTCTTLQELQSICSKHFV